MPELHRSPCHGLCRCHRSCLQACPPPSCLQVGGPAHGDGEQQHEHVSCFGWPLVPLCLLQAVKRHCPLPDHSPRKRPESPSSFLSCRSKPGSRPALSAGWRRPFLAHSCTLPVCPLGRGRFHTEMEPPRSHMSLLCQVEAQGPGCTVACSSCSAQERETVKSTGYGSSGWHPYGPSLCKLASTWAKSASSHSPKALDGGPRGSPTGAACAVCGTCVGCGIEGWGGLC